MLQHTYADGIDVGLVPGEGLAAGALPHVPQFGSSIASPRDEEFEVWGDSQAHTVSSVTDEHCLLLPRLDVPERAVGEERTSQRQATQTGAVPLTEPRKEAMGLATAWDNAWRVSLESAAHGRMPPHSVLLKLLPK